MDQNADQQKQEAPQQQMVISKTTGMVPHSLAETREFAIMLAKADALPKEFQGRPANVLLAILAGEPLGFNPAQALQGAMVINNRVSFYGDHLMAPILAHRDYEDSGDEWDPKTEGGMATFWIKRKGRSKVVRTFSMDDAKKAGLSSKPGPWQNNPKRQCYMRARAFALRDSFADVLRGVGIVEEQQDINAINTTAERHVPTPGDSPASEMREAVKAPKAAPQDEVQDAEVVGEGQAPVTQEPDNITQAPAQQAPVETPKAAATPARRSRF